MPPRAVGSGLVTQGRAGRSRAEWTGLDAEVELAVAGPGKDAEREALLVGVTLASWYAALARSSGTPCL